MRCPGLQLRAQLMWKPKPSVSHNFGYCKYCFNLLSKLNWEWALDRGLQKRAAFSTQIVGPTGNWAWAAKIAVHGPSDSAIHCDFTVKLCEWLNICANMTKLSLQIRTFSIQIWQIPLQVCFEQVQVQVHREGGQEQGQRTGDVIGDMLRSLRECKSHIVMSMSREIRTCINKSKHISKASLFFLKCQVNSRHNFCRWCW
jgi:hypothetical protein